MLSRSDILVKFFKSVKPELLISDFQCSKEILLNLGMNSKDVALIAAAIDWDRPMFSKLFKVEAGMIDKSAIVRCLLDGSFFTEESIRSLVDDLCSALVVAASSKFLPLHIDGCLYFGDLKNGKPHGSGVFVDVLGDVTGGVFHDGILNKGIKIWRNGDFFRGDFRTCDYSSDNIFCGFNITTASTGNMDLGDGRRFCGDFYRGVPDYGKVYWPNGDFFEGDLYLYEYYEGNLELYSGRFEFYDGRVFEGSFEDNIPDEGDLDWPNGDHFKGLFFDGHPWRGRLDYFDKTYYEGELDENGLYCGEGVLETANEYYEGEFVDSDLVYGYIIMMDGSEYEGECVDYLPNGCGVWTFPDGTVIEGIFSGGFLVDDFSNYDFTRLACWRLNVTDDNCNRDDASHSFYFHDDLESLLDRQIDLLLSDKLYDFISINQKIYDPHEMYEQRCTEGLLNSFVEFKLGLIDDDGFYYGEIRNGLPNGRGEYHHLGGLVESGFYVHGNLDEFGELLCFNEYYEGDFLDGVIDGRGYYCRKNEFNYTGIFANNLPDGEGCINFESGGRISGVFSKGRLVSPDVVELSDGGYYCGDLDDFNVSDHIKDVEDLMPECTGSLHFIDFVYYGDLNRGAPAGYGLYYSEEVVASGYFENWVLVGRGQCEYPDGRMYDGELYTPSEYGWEPEGYGMMYYPDGQIDEGIFKDGIIYEGIRFIGNVEIYSGRFDEHGNIDGFEEHLRQRLDQLKRKIAEVNDDDSVVPGEYIGVYRSALSGNLSSAFFIANCFYDGRRGFSESASCAYRWYCKVAKQYSLDDSNVKSTSLSKVNSPININANLQTPKDYVEVSSTLQYFKVEETNALEEMQYLDIRGLVYLCLEYHNLSSVSNLLRIYPFKTLNLKTAVDVVFGLDINKPLEYVVADLRNRLSKSMDNKEVDSFCNLFRNVANDYMEHVPRGFGRHIDDDSMVRVVRRTMKCDVCGGEIEPGDMAFIRTEPARCVRHPSCNSRMRVKIEYSHYLYYNMEIEYFEKLFSAEENTNYVLDRSLTHNIFKKIGYVADKSGVIVKLPRFSEFVLSYISGSSDYELMQEYRPYHVYIQFLLNLKGVRNFEIDNMRGYKYLLRERLGACTYPELSVSLENTTYAELFFDEPIFNLVDSHVKRAIYTIVIRKMLDEAGILVGDSEVMINGDVKSFSVNINDGSDIMITADSEGVLCTDDKISAPIDEFFDLKPGSDKYILYIRSFEVS